LMRGFRSRVYRCYLKRPRSEETMSSITELESLSSGARFYRADIHIHSFGGSHDVKDVTMTPEAIVKMAIAEKLDVIAIADHNEITNVQGSRVKVPGSNLEN
jgi:hypothetical protein